MKKLREFIKSQFPSFTIFVQNTKFLLNLSFLRKENKDYLSSIHNHYKSIETKLTQRGNRKLRIGAYVPYASSFSAYPLFDLLQENNILYETGIVIIPVICRGQNHMISEYKKTKQSMSSRFKKINIIDGWNEETGEFKDCSEMFDIIYMANPYDSMVNKIHGVKYLVTKEVLTFHINYGLPMTKYGLHYLFPTIEYNIFWRVFAENKIMENLIKKYQLVKGKNVRITGYSKTDGLVKYERKVNTKKTVIIAPHHTVDNEKLAISNFLEFSSLIPRLPLIFPDIHFIFRPHPLLFINMINGKRWTEEQKDEYLNSLKNAGVEYSYEGDYMSLFVNSDAMIHDCLSFLGEYLYTDKPCCFVNNKNRKNQFSEFGKVCLKGYYIADTEKDIIAFIQNVVINGNDTMKYKRQKLKKKIAINHPHASEMILKEITM